MHRLAPIYITSLTFLALAYSSDAFSRPSDQAKTWQPWAEIGGAFNTRRNDTIGVRATGRGETTFFVPLSGNKRSLSFAQITAKFFNNDAEEGNLAVGYRQMSQSGFNLGGWIGADVRNTTVGNTFWQLSGGVEALSENIDARLNWYVSNPGR